MARPAYPARPTTFPQLPERAPQQQRQSPTASATAHRSSVPHPPASSVRNAKKPKRQNAASTLARRTRQQYVSPGCADRCTGKKRRQEVLPAARYSCEALTPQVMDTRRRPGSLGHQHHWPLSAIGQPTRRPTPTADCGGRQRTAPAEASGGRLGGRRPTAPAAAAANSALASRQPGPLRRPTRSHVTDGSGCRGGRSRTSWATEATSVPSAVWIEPWARPRVPTWATGLIENSSH